MHAQLTVSTLLQLLVHVTEALLYPLAINFPVKLFGRKKGVHFSLHTPLRSVFSLRTRKPIGQGIHTVQVLHNTENKGQQNRLRGENGVKEHNGRDTSSNLRVLAEQSPSEAGRVRRERAAYTHLGSWIATKLSDATDPAHLVSSRVTTCPLAMSHIILLFYLRAKTACLPFTLTNTTRRGL